MNKLILQTKGTAEHLFPFTNEVGVILKAVGNYDHTDSGFLAIRFYSDEGLDGTKTIIKPDGTKVVSTITYGTYKQESISPDVDMIDGEIYRIFYSFNQGVDKLTKIAFGGNGSKNNIGFIEPFFNLSNAVNIETLGIDGVNISTSNSGNDFDIYNLSLFKNLEELLISSVYNFNVLKFGDFISAPNLKKISLGKVENVNIGKMILDNKTTLKDYSTSSLENPIDNDISLLTNTTVENISIDATSSLNNNAYWKGGRNLAFLSSIKTVYVKNGMAANEDKVDMLICLSNSSFSSEATVTFVSLTIDSSDTELTDAIATLATKCTLTINGQVVS